MSISDQLKNLAASGMTIPDREWAAHYLQHVGYHRLSSYWHHFRDQPDYGCLGAFRAGIEFGDVIGHYRFDGYLRTTLTEALGHVEVSARALWAGHLADVGGDKAHLNHALFTEKRYEQHLADLQQSYERTVEHGSPKWQDATIWEATNAMSFGQLSKWYNAINARHLRNAIAEHYGLNQHILSSVLYNLAHLRNICAHHGRLWNRNLYTGIRIPNILAEYCNNAAPHGLYNRLVMIAYLTSIVDPGAHWKSELADLMVSYPGISKDRMGFPNQWEDLDFWQG